LTPRRFTILIGILVGVPTAVIAGLGYGYWINRRLNHPLRDAMETTVEEIQAKIQTPLGELPGLFESLLPIFLAVVLVRSSTVGGTFVNENSIVGSITGFVGDPNFVLTIAALAAAYTFYRTSAINRSVFSDELTESLRSGGNIAAGGAFGAMLEQAGVGQYIAGDVNDHGSGDLRFLYFPQLNTPRSARCTDEVGRFTRRPDPHRLTNLTDGWVLRVR
jgi:gluconate:H+ symporter, GntP family